AVERILNRVTVATGFEIDEVGNVAGRDAEAELWSAQHLAVEELRAGPDRTHGRKLVHRDRLRRGGPAHRDQRDGVVGALVRGGLRRTTSGHQVKHPVRGTIALVGSDT